MGFTASLKYAWDHSLSCSSETPPVRPVWVDVQSPFARLLSDREECWYYVHIPQSSNGKYAPDPRMLEYPPLSFILGSLGLAAFGNDSTGAQVASNLLLLAFVVFMAWHGWQLAGFRGGILLGLAAAASPWTSQWMRTYNYQPGGLLMLAIAMVAAHASRGLTRPVFCACLGASLGVGLLFTQFLLFIATPWLIVLALPDLFRTRYSLLAGGLLLLVVQVIWVRYSYCMRSGPVASAWLDPYVTWSVVLLLLLLLGTAWLHARRRGWCPVTGLAVVAATAGLMSAPYYLSVQSIQMQVIQEHRFLMSCYPWMSMFMAFVESAQTLHTFHWLGLLWLTVGLLLLDRWHDFRPLARKSALWLLAGLVSMALNAPPVLKYLVVLLPLGLVPGFIWAARWKTSFVLVTLFLLGGLWIQTLGWLDIKDRRHPWLPIPILMLDTISDGVPRDFCWFYSFPMADAPRNRPWIWKKIQPRIRMCVLFLDQEIDLRKAPVTFWKSIPELECLVLYLSLRSKLVEPDLLKEGDGVLILSRFPFNLPSGPPAGSNVLSPPDHFQMVERCSPPFPFLVQFRTVLSAP
ncbi:MAG: hypothetical protein ACOX9B_08395 [Candidatus Xenobium sp.]